MQQVLADLALDVEAATALGLPPGAQLRPRLGSARGGVAPADDAGHQVLGLQDRPGPGLRGHGVPGRQRLRRGEAGGATLSRAARSMPSGKARATSWRSICCACCSASRRRSTIVMEDLGRRSRRRRATQGTSGAGAVHAARAEVAGASAGRRLAEALAPWRPARSCARMRHACVADAFIATRSVRRARARPTARDWNGPIRAPSSSAPPRPSR